MKKRKVKRIVKGFIMYDGIGKFGTQPYMVFYPKMEWAKADQANGDIIRSCIIKIR